jgi:hypothetical protein
VQTRPRATHLPCRVAMCGQCAALQREGLGRTMSISLPLLPSDSACAAHATFAPRKAHVGLSRERSMRHMPLHATCVGLGACTANGLAQPCRLVIEHDVASCATQWQLVATQRLAQHTRLWSSMNSLNTWKSPMLKSNSNTSELAISSCRVLQFHGTSQRVAQRRSALHHVVR